MSRELDIAVAKALGWRDWCPLGDFHPYALLLPHTVGEWVALDVLHATGEERIARADDKRASDYARYVPRYSTDANEAAKLWAEHLQAGTSIYFANGEWFVTSPSPRMMTLATASTLAEAICRAVIAAKGAQ